MIDYLRKYNLSEDEKEKTAYAFLRQIRKGKPNAKFWNSYNTLHKDGFMQDFLEHLKSEEVLDVNEKDRKYILSKKGEMMYKRGWVYVGKKWYDEDRVRKYALIISLLALIISVIGNDNIWKGIKYLWQLLPIR
jgi:hypothetical protein